MASAAIYLISGKSDHQIKLYSKLVDGKISGYKPLTQEHLHLPKGVESRIRMNNGYKKKFRVLDFNESKQSSDDAIDPFERHEARRKANIQRMRCERRLVVEHMDRDELKVIPPGSQKKRSVLTDKTNTAQSKTDICGSNDKKRGSIKLGDLKKVISGQLGEAHDYNKRKIPLSHEKSNSELVQLKEKEHNSGRGKLTLSNLPQLVKRTKFKSLEDNSHPDWEAGLPNFDYDSFLYLNLKSVFALQNADILRKFMSFLRINKKSTFQTLKITDLLSHKNSEALNDPRKDHSDRERSELSLSKRHKSITLDHGCTHLVKEVKQVGVHLIAVKLMNPKTNLQHTALFYRNKADSVCPGAHINLHEQNKVLTHINGKILPIYYK